MPETVLVVPCYNEADRLPRDVVLRFSKEHPDIHFLLVNDGSTDQTLARLNELAAEGEGRFSVLDQQPNRGKAEAVRSGMLEAFGRKPDFVGYWDADLATPLDELPRFQSVFEDRHWVEIVFGSRVKLLGRSIDRRPLRHFTGRIFATVVSMLLGLPLYDTQCGAKLFRVNPRIEALFAEPWISSWIFDVELIARLIRARRQEGEGSGAKIIYELPLRTWRDVEGSKLKPFDFARAFFELLAIRRRYLK